jgi:MFS family permease
VTEPHLRRRLAVLSAHALLFQMVTFLLRPTVSYRAIELDVSPAWIGLLAASFALVPLVVALPAGDLADRYGESRVMLGGAVVMAAAAALFVLESGSFAMLLIGSLLLGTGHLMCTVGQHALIANLVPRDRFDSAYGYYTFVGTIGQVAGPALLGIVGRGAAIPPTAEVFRISAAIAVGLVLVTMLVRPAPRSGTAAPSTDRRVGTLLRLPGLTRALVVSGMVLAAMDITLVYLPVLGAETGLSVAFVSALLTARSVATMAARLFTGVLTGRLGRRALLVTSIASSGVATAVVPLPVPVWLVVVAVLVIGFGLGVCQPAMLAWLAEIAPPGLSGRVMSLRLLGNRFAQVVVPSGFGLVAAGLGAAGVLWVTAGSLVAAAAATRSVPMDAPDASA